METHCLTTDESLSQADSNHHKQNQNLLCYHYTMGQSNMYAEFYDSAKVVVF